jgi:3-ketosteroid 9alpha-monooxygenase subunit B
MSGAATTPSPGCLDGRSGKVNMAFNDVLEQQDLDDGLILACQSRPETDSVEVTYDE